MRFSIFVLVLGVIFAGAAAAQAESKSNAPSATHLTIIATGIGQPDVMRIETGKKAMTADGQNNMVYRTVKPKADHVFVEIKVDLSVEPGPLFLHTSMIRLDDPNRLSAASLLPVYWYLVSGSGTTRADTLTIQDKGELDFTFEVPSARVDNLALWIAGMRVASIPEIKARVRHEGEER
jgi:hypothetical protein